MEFRFFPAYDIPFPVAKPESAIERNAMHLDVAVRCTEPEKRVVYDYTVHNLVTGRTLRRGPATPEAIEKEGGELIPETRREVDESEVDGDGFVRRKGSGS
jgi:hypothetical protein